MRGLYTRGRNSSFLLHVKLDAGAVHTVAVGGTERVQGKPTKGGRIQVEHYGWEGHYIFLDYYSLVLESIVLTDPSE